MNGTPTVTKTKSKTIVTTLLVVFGVGVLFAAAFSARRTTITRARLTGGIQRTALPNLVVEPVIIGAITRYPEVVVRNAGEATAGAFYINFSWNNGETVTLSRGAGVTLAPGATDTFFTDELANPAGSTTLTITVDVTAPGEPFDRAGRIRESNENDNVWTGLSFTRENDEPGFCTDGADNEADGLADMSDPDCADACSDSMDNNRVLGVNEGCQEPGNLLEIESGPPEDPLYACNNLDDDGDGQVDDGCDRDNDGFCRVGVAVLVYACPGTIPGNPATVDCRDNDAVSYPGLGC